MRITVVLALVGAWLTFPGSSFADLSNVTYMRAKEAYGQGHCSEAIALLQQYSSEDAGFLSDNPSIQEAIAAAIRFCRNSLLPIWWRVLGRRL